MKLVSIAVLVLVGSLSLSGCRTPDAALIKATQDEVGVIGSKAKIGLSFSDLKAIRDAANRGDGVAAVLIAGKALITPEEIAKTDSQVVTAQRHVLQVAQ